MATWTLFIHFCCCYFPTFRCISYKIHHFLFLSNRHLSQTLNINLSILRLLKLEISCSSKHIDKLLFVKLNHWTFYLHISSFFLFDIKYLFDTSVYQSMILLKLFTKDCKSFSGTCLSISKYSAIKSLK